MRRPNPPAPQTLLGATAAPAGGPVATGFPDSLAALAGKGENDRPNTETPPFPAALARRSREGGPGGLGPSEAILTFFFTDIVGSTRLWEEQPEAMRQALARHDEVLRRAIESHDGRVFKTVGDSFCAVFATATDAVAAALAAQRVLGPNPPAPFPPGEGGVSPSPKLDIPLPPWGGGAGG